MEKIIHSLINNWIRGVDTYTHNGSTWLIFTDSKKWVIELTKEKTLWYNYTFFKQVFEFMSLDVVGNQHYITKWVEDNIINKVSDIHFRDARDRKQQFEDTIENGVKNTKMAHMKTCWSVEDTIENGVKETKISPTHTEYGDWLDGGERLDEIIKNGVKETKYNQSHQEPKFKEVLKNGVKTTSALDPSFSVRFIDGDENNDWEKVPNINEVIDNGIKETHDDVYHHKGRIDGVIKNGDKISGTFVGGKLQKYKTDTVINYGVKETEPMDDWVNTNRIVDEVIDNGTKNPTD
jgi:hypothetical protein